MSLYNRAVVASGHPLVSGAAAEILNGGGNAFDAIIAAGFAGTVAEPCLTSLGGGGFLLARTAEPMAEKQEVLFDFFVDTPGLGLDTGNLEPHFFPVTVHFPGSDQDFNVGLGSVAVPGNLKGFLHVHRRLGRLPLETILQPAIRLARDGLLVSESQAYFLSLLQPIMTLGEVGKRLYAPQDTLLVCGDLLSNPALADFLEQLPSDQGDSFYHGELAGKIGGDMGRGQGLLTAEDLDAYKVIERAPLVTSYRDYTMLTNPPPSMGGSLMALSLKLLDSVAMTDMICDSAEHLTLTGDIMAEVERLRAEGLTDISLQQAVELGRTFSRGTTHMSIADCEGNVASMTCSNGEGSGYFAPDTGIMLNNMMGEDDLHPEGFHASPPGQRVASMMSPSLLLRDDEVKLVIGSGGSKRIRTALAQVLSRLVDFRVPVQEAVEAPRVHWDGTTMQLEPGFNEVAVTSLAKRWPVNLWASRDVYFGGVHAVVPGKEGAGDPRRGGAVSIVDSL
ncbi:MAG: gamma-glutamyltransferase [Thermodesulfobacteriota bacterium]